MSRLDQAISIPKSLHQYAADRDRIIEIWSSGMRELHRADEMLRSYAFCGLDSNLLPREGGVGLGSGQINTKAITRDVDRTLWRTAFDKTGLRNIMDQQAMDQFERQVRDDPPAFTMDNIEATFLEFFQQADEIFARGIYNVFRRLDHKYRTNEKEPFVIGDKAILGYRFQHRFGGGIEIRHSCDQLFGDIDRVFKTLDGKPFIPRSLESAINAEMKEPPYVYEDDYYQVKGFKNGNAHFKFKRADLLEKVNKIIAAYCGGNALAGRKVA